MKALIKVSYRGDKDRIILGSGSDVATIIVDEVDVEFRGYDCRIEVITLDKMVSFYRVIKDAERLLVELSELKER